MYIISNLQHEVIKIFIVCNKHSNNPKSWKPEPTCKYITL